MDIEEADIKSINNRDAIQKGVVCGCYFCCKVVDGGEIDEWTDGGNTAICPECGVDAIVVGISDEKVLWKMFKRWFGGIADE